VSTESVAILAASVGALGAIGGQVVAAIFTARRETRRLLWEQEQAKRAERLARTERFVELRREIFSRFLSAARDWRRFNALDSMQFEGKKWDLDNDYADDVRNSDWRERKNIVFESIAEISLIAPELEDEVWKIFNHLYNWELFALGGKGLEGRHEAFDELLATCEQKMRRNLGFTEPA
jgi:hypothetical protein